MAKKVGFVSLGCPKNLVDTEVMLGHVTRAGYELTPEPAEAEILFPPLTYMESTSSRPVEVVVGEDGETVTFNIVDVTPHFGT